MGGGGGEGGVRDLFNYKQRVDKTPSSAPFLSDKSQGAVGWPALPSFSGAKNQSLSSTFLDFLLLINVLEKVFYLRPKGQPTEYELFWTEQGVSVFERERVVANVA
jgi:hypothetical protein